VTWTWALTTWTCCAGSPASGPSASTPKRPSGLHARHEDLTFGLMHFPSGATGSWTSTGSRPPSARQPGGRRRRGHVRARLPDSEAELHSLQRRAATNDRRLRHHLHGDLGRDPDPERGAAACPARRVRACPAHWRAALCRRRGRTVGSRHRQRSADRRRRGPPCRSLRPSFEASSRMTIVSRPTRIVSFLGGSINPPANLCTHRTPRSVETLAGRARNGRPGRRSGRGQDGPAAGRPVRSPRLESDRGRCEPRCRGRHQRRPVPCREEPDWPREWPRFTPRVACTPRPMPPPPSATRTLRC